MESLEKDSVQEKVRVGYGADKNTARTKILCHVVEHAPSFLDRFKGIVHAKLHRDHVEGLDEFGRRKCSRQWLSVAVKSRKSGLEFGSLLVEPSIACLVYGHSSDVC